LPPLSIPAALLFFNVGVEIGQLIFVAVVLAVMAALRWAIKRYSAKLCLTSSASFARRLTFWMPDSGSKFAVPPTREGSVAVTAN
jgi:hypothetical protein